MKSDQQKPVSLEDLLRLKRAERPSAEFWPQFERELRAKQLAALVVRRPWWQTLPGRALAGLSRYHLPLGATAVLALTFLSVREYQVATPQRGLAPTLIEEAADAGSEAKPAPILATVDAGIRAQGLRGEERGAPVTAEVSATADTGLSGNTGSERLSAMAALIGGAATDEVSLASPSARSIAENFAAAQSEDNTFGGRPLLASAVRGFESRVMPARQPVVDPLAQMKAPSDVRRARYLGTALPVVANAKQVSPRSSERLASRISDERLYESVSSRLGVGGDRLMVKF